MAFSFIIAVINNRSLRGNAKLVAIILANFANDEGVAWPSVKTLADGCGLSSRQIQRILPLLESSGLLTIIPGGGNKHPHRYQFLHQEKGDNLSSFPYRNGDNLSRKGDTMSPDPTRTKEKKIFPGGNTTPRKLKVSL